MGREAGHDLQRVLQELVRRLVVAQWPVELLQVLEDVGLDRGGQRLCWPCAASTPRRPRANDTHPPLSLTQLIMR